MALGISGIAWTRKAKELSKKLSVKDFDWAVRSAFISVDQKIEKDREKIRAMPRDQRPSTELLVVAQDKNYREFGNYEETSPGFEAEDAHACENNPKHKALIEHLEHGIRYLCVDADDLLDLRAPLEQKEERAFLAKTLKIIRTGTDYVQPPTNVGKAKGR